MLLVWCRLRGRGGEGDVDKPQCCNAPLGPWLECLFCAEHGREANAGAPGRVKARLISPPDGGIRELQMRFADQ